MCFNLIYCCNLLFIPATCQNKDYLVRTRKSRSYYSYFFSSRILSESKNLEVGKRYYLELIGCEWIKGDYFTVNVILPDGSLIDPIIYNYLEPITSP